MLVFEIAYSYIKKDFRKLIRYLLLFSVPCALFLLLSNIAVREVIHKPVMPMFVVMGERVKSISRLYASIPNHISERINNDLDNECDIIKFNHYNLQDLYIFQTFTRLRFSVLILPDEFIKKRLSNVLSEGNLPNESQPGCLIGGMAVELWDLRLGDRIVFNTNNNLSFEKVDANGNPDAIEISGVLDRVDMQYLEGAILVPCSVADKIFDSRSLGKENGLLVYPRLNHIKYSFLRSYFTKLPLTLVIQRPPIINSGTVGLGLFVLLFWTSLNIILTSSSYVSENVIDIGILRSLGIRSQELKCSFVTISLATQFIGIILTCILTFVLIKLANHFIASKAQLDFLDHYYSLHKGPFLILGGILLLSATVSVMWTLRKLSSTSPDEMIRKVQQ